MSFQANSQISGLLETALQRCFTVTLQKCFVDYETPPNFPSAWGCVDNDLIFSFG